VNTCFQNEILVVQSTTCKEALSVYDGLKCILAYHAYQGHVNILWYAVYKIAVLLGGKASINARRIIYNGFLLLGKQGWQSNYSIHVQDEYS
jgi:hypothetical protein